MGAVHQSSKLLEAPSPPAPGHQTGPCAAFGEYCGVKRTAPVAPAYGRATPALRLEPPANLPVGAGQLGCRSSLRAEGREPVASGHRKRHIHRRRRRTRHRSPRRLIRPFHPGSGIALPPCEVTTVRPLFG